MDGDSVQILTPHEKMSIRLDQGKIIEIFKTPEVTSYEIDKKVIINDFTKMSRKSKLNSILTQ